MQERPVFDNLSVRDNLLLMLPADALKTYRPYFEAFPVLEKRLGQNAGTLSGGERKILSFVRAMAENGSVTLLDEPSEGVQPENIEKMKHLILERKAKGDGFVVVEQHLHLAEAIADVFLLMDQGQQILQGPASEVGRDTILQHLEV
ncbi:MAG: ATP-binding cassette domain-containing protein [Hyphomicrobiales bacterium]|nr:ATP-binding cassette domain-containing protein [Hyphomicrobiales bacterium]MCP5000181.1 ATP-binding cassette domain-containing protein [Hyphomicrobiales bacterium]